jgi:Protein of unknown function (DUF742)
MTSSDERWLDGEAGPVVRPYALVGGRTRPAGRSFDLIAMVTAARRASVDPDALEPEHLRALRLCRVPRSVADLASDLGLPVGVARVILADLWGKGLVVVRQPAPPAQLKDLQLLRRVADGLRRL